MTNNDAGVPVLFLVDDRPKETLLTGIQKVAGLNLGMYTDLPRVSPTFLSRTR